MWQERLFSQIILNKVSIRYCQMQTRHLQFYNEGSTFWKKEKRDNKSSYYLKVQFAYVLHFWYLSTKEETHLIWLRRSLSDLVTSATAWFSSLIRFSSAPASWQTATRCSTARATSRTAPTSCSWHAALCSVGATTCTQIVANFNRLYC